MNKRSILEILSEIPKMKTPNNNPNSIPELLQDCIFDFDGIKDYYCKHKIPTQKMFSSCDYLYIQNEKLYFFEKINSDRIDDMKQYCAEMVDGFLKNGKLRLVFLQKITGSLMIVSAILYDHKENMSNQSFYFDWLKTQNTSFYFVFECVDERKVKDIQITIQDLDIRFRDSVKVIFPFINEVAIRSSKYWQDYLPRK